MTDTPRDVRDQTKLIKMNAGPAAQGRLQRNVQKAADNYSASFGDDRKKSVNNQLINLLFITR